MIRNVSLHNFRNFKKKILEFSPTTTIIVGPNASGKTNILESLFLLSTGKSFRARIEGEMIGYNTDIARINGQVVSSKQQEVGAQPHATSYRLPATKLEVVLTRGFIDVGNSVPEKVSKKKLLVNGIPKRLIDFAGNFKVTLFGPWDMDLVTESPSLRRRFMDTVLSQADREYRRAILSYEKGLRQRNRVLWEIRERLSMDSGRDRLLFWNQLLIKNGDIISQKRQEMIDFINNTPALNDQDFELVYDKSAISEGRLEQYAEEEIAAATTLVGPHRDDFVFRITNHESRITRDLSRYGSRGEQRMSVLWLKLAELAFVETKTGERPTLLLDDIFSELDHEHRDVVKKIIGNQQTIITTADEHFIKGFKKGEIIELI